MPWIIEREALRSKADGVALCGSVGIEGLPGAFWKFFVSANY